MMPTPSVEYENLSNMLSMDSILSPSFWDSVLIPGTCSPPSLCV
jgi:hypothetical protein